MSDTVSTAWVEEAWNAARALGMTPADTDFAAVPGDILWGVASYGWPHFLSHWTYGRDYWRIRQQNITGHSRLLELVLPGEPCLAYLDASSPLADQKLVVCHVAGHCDVFARHPLFQDLRPDLPSMFWSAAERVDRYREMYGEDAVEELLDAAFSIAEQVGEDPTAGPAPALLDSHWDLFRPSVSGPMRQPPSRWNLPTRDLVGFLAREAPLLEAWQRDLLEMVRLDSLMRRTIRMTKVIHEGYATWTHHHLLNTLPLDPSERLQAARSQAFVTWQSPLHVNPYGLGYRLFRRIEDSEGASAVLRTATTLTDGEFLGRYLTAESMAALELYQYTWKDARSTWKAVRQDKDWQAVRDELVNRVVQQPPQVAVRSVEQDYTLALAWEDPVPWDEEWARLSLQAVHRLWRAPVRLEREEGPPLVTEGSEVHISRSYIRDGKS